MRQRVSLCTCCRMCPMAGLSCHRGPTDTEGSRDFDNFSRALVRPPPGCHVDFASVLFDRIGPLLLEELTCSTSPPVLGHGWRRDRQNSYFLVLRPPDRCCEVSASLAVRGYNGIVTKHTPACPLLRAGTKAALAPFNAAQSNKPNRTCLFPVDKQAAVCTSQRRSKRQASPCVSADTGPLPAAGGRHPRAF